MTTTLTLPSVNNSATVEYRLHHGTLQRRELAPSGAAYDDGTSEWRDADQAFIDLAYAQRTSVSEWLDRIATPQAMLDVVRGIVGRRHRISRADMRAMLTALAPWVDLGNGWMGSRPQGSDSDNAAAWTRGVKSITVISVLAPANPRFGSNPGSIRFDEPGSMHPQMRATVMFYGADAAERGTTVEYLRERTGRLFVVEED